ncbi:hypothetical protein PVAND_011135 [Polypedilum vanderplanki]|uniref:F-box domain-containing protein n=1 Tax=Polypedilum vanderplanki TaxID=319348 RepID=A0A9J6CID9_POLVA|nr:hypothetical protein PVAND_011135 [Polypedilum vanderplanki]
MDPFEKLPEEIYDQILKYFEIDETIFTLSQVSKRWYEVVGKSSVCMQKVKINLKSKRKNDFVERIETLKWMSQKNARKYQIIQANCLFDEKVSDEFYNFLKTANSLEYINMRSMKLEGQELESISLPKLEYLKVMFIPREVINNLITSTSNLSQLILWNETPLSYDDLNYQPSEKTIESARWCLENNSLLTELEIQGRANFFAFFEKDIAPYVKCHLKKLTVKIEMKPKLWTDYHVQHFINFLASQADFLEYIYIDSCPPAIIKYVFNDMPKLKSIRFDIEQTEPDKIDVKVLDLNVNQNITSFEMPYIVRFDDLKDFLVLVPNVEKILIGHVIPRLMEFVVTSLTHLESLVYRYDDCAGGCEQLYKNMLQNNPENNEGIKLSVCNDFM